MVDFEPEVAPEPLWQTAPLFFTEPLQKQLSMFISDNEEAFADLPEAVSTAEDERLNACPPLNLRVASQFISVLEKRDGPKLFEAFLALTAEPLAAALERGAAERDAVVAACEDALRADNFDTALSFDGSMEIFQKRDKVCFCFLGVFNSRIFESSV